MKARRFFWVKSARSRTLHIQLGRTHSEGKTICGRIVSKGWFWYRNRKPREAICKQCQESHVGG